MCIKYYFMYIECTSDSIGYMIFFSERIKNIILCVLNVYKIISIHLFFIKHTKNIIMCVLNIILCTSI